MVLFDYGYVQVRLGGYMTMVRGTAMGLWGTCLWYGVRLGGYMPMVRGTAKGEHDCGTGYG